jgi:hypothetical protein
MEDSEAIDLNDDYALGRASFFGVVPSLSRTFSTSEIPLLGTREDVVRRTLTLASHLKPTLLLLFEL